MGADKGRAAITDRVAAPCVMRTHEEEQGKCLLNFAQAGQVRGTSGGHDTDAPEPCRLATTTTRMLARLCK
ncbi:hypothetical protein O3P69_001923 [Scylla paramamosain]|uniref:Uncharacterized protein n=1 Tax=Scylla paramamosain TaxID=85552 RepID=A0AAW0V2Y3_SCYPA